MGGRRPRGPPDTPRRPNSTWRRAPRPPRPDVVHVTDSSAVSARSPPRTPVCAQVHFARRLTPDDVERASRSPGTASTACHRCRFPSARRCRRHARDEYGTPARSSGSPARRPRAGGAVPGCGREGPTGSGPRGSSRAPPRAAGRAGPHESRPRRRATPFHELGRHGQRIGSGGSTVPTLDRTHETARPRGLVHRDDRRPRRCRRFRSADTTSTRPPDRWFSVPESLTRLQARVAFDVQGVETCSPTTGRRAEDGRSRPNGLRGPRARFVRPGSAAGGSGAGWRAGGRTKVAGTGVRGPRTGFVRRSGREGEPGRGRGPLGLAGESRGGAGGRGQATARGFLPDGRESAVVDDARHPRAAVTAWFSPVAGDRWKHPIRIGAVRPRDSG